MKKSISVNGEVIGFCNLPVVENDIARCDIASWQKQKEKDFNFATELVSRLNNSLFGYDANSVKKLLENNNIKTLNYSSYELFSPFGVLLKNELVLKLTKFFDNFLSKTPLRLILLRWYILAEKK